MFSSQGFLTGLNFSAAASNSHLTESSHFQHQIDSHSTHQDDSYFLTIDELMSTPKSSAASTIASTLSDVSSPVLTLAKITAANAAAARTSPSLQKENGATKQRFYSQTVEDKSIALMNDDTILFSDVEHFSHGFVSPLKNRDRDTERQPSFPLASQHAQDPAQELSPKIPVQDHPPMFPNETRTISKQPVVHIDFTSDDDSPVERETSLAEKSLLQPKSPVLPPQQETTKAATPTENVLKFFSTRNSKTYLDIMPISNSDTLNQLKTRQNGGITGIWAESNVPPQEADPASLMPENTLLEEKSRSVADTFRAINGVYARICNDFVDENSEIESPEQSSTVTLLVYFQQSFAPLFMGVPVLTPREIAKEVCAGCPTLFDEKHNASREFSPAKVEDLPIAEIDEGNDEWYETEFKGIGHLGPSLNAFIARTVSLILNAQRFVDPQKPLPTFQPNFQGAPTESEAQEKYVDACNKIKTSEPTWKKMATAFKMLHREIIRSDIGISAIRPKHQLVPPTAQPLRWVVGRGTVLEYINPKAMGGIAHLPWRKRLTVLHHYVHWALQLSKSVHALSTVSRLGWGPNPSPTCHLNAAVYGYQPPTRLISSARSLRFMLEEAAHKSRSAEYLANAVLMLPFHPDKEAELLQELGVNTGEHGGESGGNTRAVFQDRQRHSVALGRHPVSGSVYWFVQAEDFNQSIECPQVYSSEQENEEEGDTRNGNGHGYKVGYAEFQLYEETNPYVQRLPKSRKTTPARWILVASTAKQLQDKFVTSLDTDIQRLRKQKSDKKQQTALQISVLEKICSVVKCIIPRLRQGEEFRVHDAARREALRVRKDRELGLLRMTAKRRRRLFGDDGGSNDEDEDEGADIAARVRSRRVAQDLDKSVVLDDSGMESAESGDSDDEDVDIGLRMSERLLAQKTDKINAGRMRLLQKKALQRIKESEATANQPEGDDEVVEIVDDSIEITDDESAAASPEDDGEAGMDTPTVKQDEHSQLQKEDNSGGPYKTEDNASASSSEQGASGGDDKDEDEDKDDEMVAISDEDHHSSSSESSGDEGDAVLASPSPKQQRAPRRRAAPAPTPQPEARPKRGQASRRNGSAATNTPTASTTSSQGVSRSGTDDAELIEPHFVPKKPRKRPHRKVDLVKIDDQFDFAELEDEHSNSEGEGGSAAVTATATGDGDVIMIDVEESVPVPAPAPAPAPTPTPEPAPVSLPPARGPRKIATKGKGITKPKAAAVPPKPTRKARTATKTEPAPVIVLDDEVIELKEEEKEENGVVPEPVKIEAVASDEDTKEVVVSQQPRTRPRGRRVSPVRTLKKRVIHEKVEPANESEVYIVDGGDEEVVELPERVPSPVASPVAVPAAAARSKRAPAATKKKKPAAKTTKRKRSGQHTTKTEHAAVQEDDGIVEIGSASEAEGPVEKEQAVARNGKRRRTEPADPAVSSMPDDVYVVEDGEPVDNDNDDNDIFYSGASRKRAPPPTRRRRQQPAIINVDDSDDILLVEREDDLM